MFVKSICSRHIVLRVKTVDSGEELLNVNISHKINVRPPPIIFPAVNHANKMCSFFPYVPGPESRAPTPALRHFWKKAFV